MGSARSLRKQEPQRGTPRGKRRRERAASPHPKLSAASASVLTPLEILAWLPSSERAAPKGWVQGRVRRRAANESAHAPSELGYAETTMQASCDERAIFSRRRSCPETSRTQRLPRPSPGVTTQPWACWTLYESSATAVVFRRRPSVRWTRRVALSPLVTYARAPRKVTCCGGRFASGRARILCVRAS